MAQCSNCNTQLSGPFCPKCGQKDVNLERPFLELLGEITRETFDVDGRAWRTLKTLFAHPGQLTAEFLAGKRRKYTPPLRLYLFISVGFFILIAWIAGQGLLLDQGQSAETHAESQARFMSDDMPRLMFLLLPVFALLLKAVFPRRLYFDHLIFSVHLHSAAFVILALILPFEKIANQNLPALALQVTLMAYFIFYLVTSMRRVYSVTWPGTIGRAAAVLFGYLVVFSLLIEGTSSYLIISD
ncbi:MAG: DUF3667 domain-containing protein [Woeseiaceae bacterium]|nr:DUF3667 domain-containing protein [Woeseiaceae bacterium]